MPRFRDLGERMTAKCPATEQAAQITITRLLNAARPVLTTNRVLLRVRAPKSAEKLPLIGRVPGVNNHLRPECGSPGIGLTGNANEGACSFWLIGTTSGRNRYGDREDLLLEAGRL